MFRLIFSFEVEFLWYCFEDIAQPSFKFLTSHLLTTLSRTRRKTSLQIKPKPCSCSAGHFIQHYLEHLFWETSTKPFQGQFLTQRLQKMQLQSNIPEEYWTLKRKLKTGGGCRGGTMVLSARHRNKKSLILESVVITSRF